MTYESDWKGESAKVRYFWRTYIQVCREHPRFAASEVSVAQVFSFNFRRCSGGVRRSVYSVALSHIAVEGLAVSSLHRPRIIFPRPEALCSLRRRKIAGKDWPQRDNDQVT